MQNKKVAAFSEEFWRVYGRLVVVVQGQFELTLTYLNLSIDISFMSFGELMKITYDNF